MASYYFWLAIFGIILYLSIIDENVLEFIHLFFRGVWVQLNLYYQLVRLHPFWFMNPVGKWLMMRKYRKMAREMAKSIEERNKVES